MENEVLQMASTVSMTIFEGTRKYVDMFVPILFIGRIAFANFMAQDGSEYVSALKGLMTYFVLMACFEPLMNIVFSIPDAFSWKNFLGSTTGITSTDPDTLNKVIDSQSVDLSFFMRRFFELITIGAYYIAMVLHVLVSIVFSAMYPIFIMLSVMLGMGVGASVFIGMLVIVSCWPLLFVSFDYVSVILAGSPKFQGKMFIIVEMIVQILKVVSPLTLGALALRSVPGQAVASGINGTWNNGRPFEFFGLKRNSTVMEFDRGRDAMRSGMRSRI